MNNEDIKFGQKFTEVLINRQLTPCVPQFADGLFGSWGPRHKPT